MLCMHLTKAPLAHLSPGELNGETKKSQVTVPGGQNPPVVTEKLVRSWDMECLFGPEPMQAAATKM